MIEYRPAGPADADAIAFLHTRSWRENYRGSLSDAFLDRELPEERLRVWRDRLARPPRNQFVQLAVDAKELVGFVCAYGAHELPWGSLVDNLHVAKATKRTGIGASLMRRAGAWLAHAYPDLGVYLWVLEVNSSARRFYERLGAQNAGVSVMETHGGAVVRSCRYTWPRPSYFLLSDEKQSGKRVSFDSQPTLNGTVVELRALRPEDHDDLYAVAADPLIWEQHPAKNRHEEAGFGEFFAEALASGGALLATDAETKRVIGYSRFHGYSEERSEVEIGWTFLARSHWGGRYNGELKQLMLRHAFRFVKSVVFFVNPENVRSQRAVQKIEGVLEPEFDAKGRLVYRITASAFASRDGRLLPGYS